MSDNPHASEAGKDTFSEGEALVCAANGPRVAGVPACSWPWPGRAKGGCRLTLRQMQQVQQVHSTACGSALLSCRSTASSARPFNLLTAQSLARPAGAAGAFRLCGKGARMFPRCLSQGSFEVNGRGSHSFSCFHLHRQRSFMLVELGMLVKIKLQVRVWIGCLVKGIDQARWEA